MKGGITKMEQDFIRLVGTWPLRYPAYQEIFNKKVEDAKDSSCPV